MKITGIRATPVNIPLEAPYLWSVGSIAGFTKVIVEVVTDEGLVGLGEAPSASCRKFLVDQFASQLIGRDALDIEGCRSRCVPEVLTIRNLEEETVVKAFGALEMALWDLRGKAWQQPLYQLLGGAVRKDILFAEYFGPRLEKDGKGGENSAVEVARYCSQMRDEHGSTIFEGKIGVGSAESSVEFVREVRSAIGQDAVLRLDANMAFSVAAAHKVLAAIEPYDISNLEDPVASFYDMAKLRQHSSIPFSSHIPDLRLAVRLGVPDTIVLNLTSLGGISRTLKFIAACEAMGVGFSFYSGDAGIASAAYLHVGAATWHIRGPSQSLFHWQADDVIEEGPFQLVHNVVRVPEAPGLGVTLSASGLKRCHERYQEEGSYDYHHNPADPGKFVRLPHS